MNDTDFRNKRIDWGYWLSLRFVSAWDAVSLSLQIDPDSWDGMKRRYRSGPGGGYIPGEGLNRTQFRTLEEHSKRFDLLLDALDHDERFSDVPREQRWNHHTTLSAFAWWLASLPYPRDPPLPPELAALARASAVQRVAKDSEKKSVPPDPELPATKADWRDSARQIADQLFDRDTGMRTRDSLRGYSERVMKEMQAQGITGPQGIIGNPRTVMREALQGNRWWARKKK